MARRWKKFAGHTSLVIIALIAIGITFTIGWRPFKKFIRLRGSTRSILPRIPIGREDRPRKGERAAEASAAERGRSVAQNRIVSRTFAR